MAHVLPTKHTVVKKGIYIEIDGVFAGGGVKGFAYIGAIEELEQSGIHFKRVAGTSAGAIIAAFLAAGISSEEMKKYLAELDHTVMRDETKLVQKLPFLKWLRLYKKLGLYRGVELERWLEKKLAQKGIFTFADLEPGVLKIVASDLTNGEIVVLPDDLKKYNIDENHFSVAKAIRMSCSLPFFYEPVCLSCNGKKALIVDGGVLSNFPLWLFDQSIEERPVIGFQLTSQHNVMGNNSEIDNGVQLVEALFKTMKNAHDRRHIENQLVKQIIFLPVDELVSTMDDQIDEKMMEKLMEIGRERTKAYLSQWTRVW